MKRRSHRIRKAGPVAEQGNLIMQIDFAQQSVRRFLREGFVVLSSQQMDMIKEGCRFDQQRAIDADHVRVLAELMRSHQWQPKDKMDFALLGDQLILVNGYHRVNAQVSTGMAIEWTVVIHPCSTMDEVRSLYYKFDTNNRTRTQEQILNGIGWADRCGLSKQMGKALFGAIPFIAAGLTADRTKRDLLTNRIVDRRLQVATDYLRAARLYEECIESAPAKVKAKLLNNGCASVALVTLRFQEAVAMKFWRGVAENDGLKRGDPRHTLVNDILTRNFNSGGAGQTIVAPATAWNAFFENRQLKIIKIYEDRNLGRLAGCKGFEV